MQQDMPFPMPFLFLPGKAARSVLLNKSFGEVALWLLCFSVCGVVEHSSRAVSLSYSGLSKASLLFLQFLPTLKNLSEVQGTTHMCPHCLVCVMANLV